ncbi:MAG: rhodanese-like domain-containing protein [Candidatus Moraniibacteriota bacterium]
MLNKKDSNALLIGLGLIVLVMLITFFRGILFAKNQADLATQQNENQAETASGEKYQTISPTELKKKLDTHNPPKINLLDIRGLADFANQHIIDSVNVPLEEFPVGTRIDAKNLTILITADLTDGNIEKALKSLKEQHFDSIKVLAGGISAWEDLIGATINYGDPTSFVDQSKVSYVENDQLHEALKAKVPTFILDVRTPAQYADGHLQGAVNLPFEELEKRRNELRAYPKIVITGINELQEFQAGVQLYDMLMIQPFVLKEGIPGWKKKNFELVK